MHSVVGREDEFSDGIPNRFLDTSRGPDGRYTANATASVHFVLRENGLLIQMYPLFACTWTSGGPDANTTTISIEAEGGLAPNYGEPLTPAAEDTFCRLVRDLRPLIGPAVSSGAGKNLWQHKELAAKYGTAPTACASDRYARAWVRAVRDANEEEDMPDPLTAAVAQALTGLTDPAAQLKRLQAWNGSAFATGNSLLDGYTLQQNRLGAVVSQSSAAVKKAYEEAK